MTLSEQAGFRPECINQIFTLNKHWNIGACINNLLRGLRILTLSSIPTTARCSRDMKHDGPAEKLIKFIKIFYWRIPRFQKRNANQNLDR